MVCADDLVSLIRLQWCTHINILGPSPTGRLKTGLSLLPDSELPPPVVPIDGQEQAEPNHQFTIRFVNDVLKVERVVRSGGYTSTERENKEYEKRQEENTRKLVQVLPRMGVVHWRVVNADPISPGAPGKRKAADDRRMRRPRSCSFCVNHHVYRQIFASVQVYGFLKSALIAADDFVRRFIINCPRLSI